MDHLLTEMLIPVAAAAEATRYSTYRQWHCLYSAHRNKKRPFLPFTGHSACLSVRTSWLGASEAGIAKRTWVMR